MSISGVSSITAYAPSGAGIQWQQEMHDYQALTIAIQSGNLVSITKAFAAWQQDLHASANTQNSKQAQPIGAATQANPNFEALSKAIQTGNVSSAQTAFAKLQKDLQSAGILRNRANGGTAAGQNGNGSSVTTPNPVTTSAPTTNAVSTSTSISASGSTPSSGATSAPSSVAVTLDTLS